MAEERFCRTPFWAFHNIWNTDAPRLTACFENTILAIFPLIIITVLILRKLTTNDPPSEECPPPRITLLKLAKFVLIISLISRRLWFMVELSTATDRPYSQLLSAVLHQTTSVLALFYQIAQNQQHTSMGLFVFWWTYTFTELHQFYHYVLLPYMVDWRDEIMNDKTIYLLAVQTYPFIVGSAIFSCFREPVVRRKDRSPYYYASPWERVLFGWVGPLLATGYVRPLLITDMFPIIDQLKASVLYSRFDKHLADETKNVQAAIMQTFKVTIRQALFFSMVFFTIRQIPAVVMSFMIDHLSDSDEENWKGYFFAFVMFAFLQISMILFRHIDHTMLLLGLQIKSALLLTVYKKLLRISHTSLSQYTVGEIVNLIAIDVDKIQQIAGLIAAGVGAPYNCFICGLALSYFLGISALAGFASMLVLIPVTLVISRTAKYYQEIQMRLKGTRVKYTVEAISNMKILKFYTWEPAFILRIQESRKTETGSLKMFALLQAGLRGLWISAPFTVAFFALASYVYINDLNVLDPRLSFVTLVIVSNVRFSLAVFPELIANYIQTQVSLRRINEFLNKPDSDTAIGNTTINDNAQVEFNNVTLSWPPNPPVIHDLTLKVRPRTLIAIMGKVGSGKTSLLHALLGNMKIEKGSINVKGTIAYIPQTAWIKNATVRRNIVLDKPYKTKKYDRIVNACCLMRDFEILDGGDMAELGEKGGNISGGQKQRISIARSIYQNRDVYILDDPLSAVDSHVATDIFKQVLSDQGILRSKTRIFVTNTLVGLKEIDCIYVMENGKIVDYGNYDELCVNSVVFRKLIQEIATSPPEGSILPKPQLLSRDLILPKSQSFFISEFSEIEQPLKETRELICKEEEVQTGNIKIDVYINYIKALKYSLCLKLLFTYSMVRVSDVGCNYYLKSWSRPSNTSKLVNIAIMGALGIAQSFFAFQSAAMLSFGCIRASMELHDRMLQSVMRAPISFFDANPAGRIVNRFGKDIDQLDVQMPQHANILMELMVQISAMAVLTILNVPPFAGGILVAAVLYIFITRYYLRTVRQVKRLESSTRSPVFIAFNETVTGIDSIRAFQIQKYLLEEAELKIDTTQNATYMLHLSKTWMTARLNVMVCTLLLILNVCILQYRSSIDGGYAGMLLSYFLAATYAFNFIAQFAAEVETSVISSERVEEYTKIKGEAPWQIPKNRPDDDWPQKGEITFENFSMRYRDDLDVVLRDINLVVKPQESVGIVGRTGAGKSSLTLALYRMNEAASGLIKIDDLDISTIGLHDLRSRITIIPQEPVLFTGTVRFNLDPTERFSDDRLEEALRIIRMEDAYGLTEMIEEGGTNYSLGQRQLLCLARAILQKTKILVLDEATAAVDLETDSFIQRTIHHEFKECTILTIAHRIHTIMDCDQVIVMDRGSIVEKGNPRQLMTDPSKLFYSLAKDAGISHATPPRKPSAT